MDRKSEILDSKGISKKKIHLEIAGLMLLMFIVWGLLALPVIFYYLPLTVVSLNLIPAICMLSAKLGKLNLEPSPAPFAISIIIIGNDDLVQLRSINSAIELDITSNDDSVQN